VKKWFGLLSVLFLFNVSAKAELFESKEDRSYFVRYNLSVPSASASTATVVISLSSNASTNEWPHVETGELTLSNIKIELDKVAASTVSVRLGVVTAVNASSGSVTWFTGINSLLNVSNTMTNKDGYGTDTVYRLRVTPGSAGAEGKTPYLLSSEKLALSASGSTVYQTDVKLPSPASTGGSFPGIGDLVMDVTKTISAVVNVAVELKYSTRRR
jgi:hypothetical protein